MIGLPPLLLERRQIRALFILRLFQNAHSLIILGRPPSVEILKQQVTALTQRTDYLRRFGCAGLRGRKLLLRLGQTP